MKYAIATENGKVSGHFGKCKLFTLVKIEDGKAVEIKEIDTASNGHHGLPPFLKSQEVDVTLSGGMGDGAKRNLESFGIEYVVGVVGKIDDVIKALEEGNLSKFTFESSHDHHHSPGHKCNC